MTLPTRDLRYSIDVYDARANLVEHLADLDDFDPARAAFVSLCDKYPGKRIFLRNGGRTLARSDEPPDWMATYRPIPVFQENPVEVPQEARAYPPLAPEKRPQDRSLDGRGLNFKTLEHGGEYPDTMPQAIRMTDPLGRSAIYVPLKIDGKVVDAE